MSSEVTHITSSHGASEPNFLTSWVTQSRIIEEQNNWIHELQRRKTVSYGCFYFSHINGGWHRFYDLVDCSVLHKLSLRRYSVRHNHMLMWIQNPVTDKDMGTFNPKYFLQLSFCLSVSLLSSPHAFYSPSEGLSGWGEPRGGSYCYCKNMVWKLRKELRDLKDSHDCACLANFQRMCLFYISETVWELSVRFCFIFLNIELVIFHAGQVGFELMAIIYISLLRDGIPAVCIIPG